MKTFFVLILLTVSIPAADDRQHIAKLTTVSGKTFEQVSISKVSALEIRFTHANGIAAVPMADLPPDMQKLFGFDPVAADFAMINAREERRIALIEQEKHKAEQLALQKKQHAEHVAIQAIERKAIKLSLLVAALDADGGAKCKAWGIGYKELKGSKKTHAKKTMSGDYEKVEVLTALPMPGEPGSFLDGLGVIVHGMKTDTVGKQVVMVVYPVGEAKKGETQQYATDCSIAYSILKQQGKLVVKE